MRIGVVFPQTELGGDVGAVRAYGERVDELGYTHILAYDHVVGADPVIHQNWSGPYNVDTTFHEPFVMFGYLAAVTSVELVTGIIILPQRQTALVAKQAAEVDLLTAGRLRLGVGIGWNAVEYEALSKDFTNRGRRLEEQIELMRRLWTESTVTFDGTYETVTGAGLNPLPVQRPIPVWIGGVAEAALRRAGRMADGWFPMVPPGQHLDAARDIVSAAASQAGRDPSTLGMEGRIGWGEGGVDELVKHAARWREAGATHIAVNTMGGGFETPDDHLDALDARRRGTWTPRAPRQLTRRAQPRIFESSRRISRYSQTIVIVIPNAPYHSICFGAPATTMRRIISKSTNRLSAATMQMSTLIPMPSGLGEFQNVRSVPNNERMNVARYITKMPAVAAITTKMNLFVTFTMPET